MQDLYNFFCFFNFIFYLDLELKLEYIARPNFGIDGRGVRTCELDEAWDDNQFEVLKCGGLQYSSKNKTNHSG